MILVGSDLRASSWMKVLSSLNLASSLKAIRQPKFSKMTSQMKRKGESPAGCCWPWTPWVECLYCEGADR